MPRKSPSVLLEESAYPFDRACMQVRDLEACAVQLVMGRFVSNLNVLETCLLNLLVDMGLVYIADDQTIQATAVQDSLPLAS